MAARADLSEVRVDGWHVLVKAPAQARVPFWTATHDACGVVADLPHVSLVKAIAGKGGLPRCVVCQPEGPNIDHGLHLACGSTHLIGTACPDGVQREPGPNTVGRLPATTNDFPPAAAPSAATACAEPNHPVTVPHTPISWSLDDLPISDEESTRVVVDIDMGSASVEEFKAAIREHLDLPIYRLIEPEPAADPMPEPRAVLHGRVDRLEAPQDALDVIRRAMAAQERNHQSEPGPSQFGGCERRLGYHLATGIGNGNTDDGAWRPQVGTAVHAWLDEVFTREGREHGRWISDYRVTNPVAGKADLVDTVGLKVVDFKVTGKSTRDKAARGQVSDKYEVQLDLYALGLINDGYRIETVALLLLPASGSLSEAVWYERPVDLDRAREAVARRDRINAMLSVAPIERVLPVLSTSDDYCGSCVVLGKGCDGFAVAAATPALRMVGGAA